MLNSKSLKQLIGKNHPRVDKVGIAILYEKPDGLSQIGRRATHCNMVAKAREGNIFYAEDVNYSCGLAAYTLGLGQNAPAFRREISKGLRIRNAEKEEISGKLLDTTPRLPEKKKFVVFFPLDRMPLKPDVVVLIGSAREIMKVVWHITSLTGERLEATLGAIGATCIEMTVQPLLTGKPNLSVGCGGSRKWGKLGNDEVMFSLPWDLYQQFFEPKK